MPEFDRVREALRASMSAWATLEVRGDQARVIPVPDPDQLALHLETADPHWALAWACDSVQPPVVRARLTLLGVTREGLSGGHTLMDAKAAALADAVRTFGVAPAGEIPWVEYDAEDGPNTSDLDEVTPLPSVPAAALPPEPPRDPQMEKARDHINDLLEQLRAAGRGKETTRFMMRGYGENVEESRAIYKEIQALLKN
ncbi:single-stranded DNA-binding protein [Deinococcus arenicola]|uniref:Single-stranded DNA-binding protein n=1 Tax=Deinococcus arenicola TaxID=2994950 RepID=A0ABU4DTE7_9DEIO|nr:single-stranded DNA-binding protein [Deinococcus sp. ZS9-10]MDV6375155.1 single-stranded DNA-binding protein [Deinococcus sp. ZS9-10]